MEQTGRIYSPGQAAQVLGVTTQTLRRYAEDYAKVFEPITQHGRQRVFDDLFVERLRRAQALQTQNLVPSILAGLERVRDGDPETEDLATPEQTPFERAVLERLNALAEMVVQLGEQNRVLQGRLQQLEAPRDDTREKDLQAQVADLAQRNRALFGELERRKREADQEPARRPWWRFWERS